MNLSYLCKLCTNRVNVAIGVRPVGFLNSWSTSCHVTSSPRRDSSLQMFRMTYKSLSLRPGNQSENLSIQSRKYFPIKTWDILPVLLTVRAARAQRSPSMPLCSEHSLSKLCCTSCFRDGGKASRLSFSCCTQKREAAVVLIDATVGFVIHLPHDEVHTLSKEAKFLKSSQAKRRKRGLTAPFFVIKVWSWTHRIQVGEEIRMFSKEQCQHSHFVFVVNRTWLLNAESLSFFPKAPSSFWTISFLSGMLSGPRENRTAPFFFVSVCRRAALEAMLITRHTPWGTVYLSKLTLDVAGQDCPTLDPRSAPLPVSRSSCRWV